MLADVWFDFFTPLKPSVRVKLFLQFSLNHIIMLQLLIKYPIRSIQLASDYIFTKAHFSCIWHGCYFWTLTTSIRQGSFWTACDCLSSHAPLAWGAHEIELLQPWNVIVAIGCGGIMTLLSFLSAFLLSALLPVIFDESSCLTDALQLGLG